MRLGSSFQAGLIPWNAALARNADECIRDRSSAVVRGLLERTETPGAGAQCADDPRTDDAVWPWHHRVPVPYRRADDPVRRGHRTEVDDPGASGAWRSARGLAAQRL